MIDTGTVAPSTAPETSPSVADYAGSLFGDYLPAGDVPADDDPQDAGAPPADADDAAADDATRSEGREATDAHAEAPSADAAAANARPDAAGSDSLPASDDSALEGYAPLSYNVDGETRAIDGIQEHPEYGAIVDPTFLPTLKQRLSERDHLFEQNRAQYERQQHLEQVTRWPVRNPQTGQTEYVTGAAAIEARQVLLARSMAINEALVPILDGTVDPKSLLMWDEQHGVTWNPEALNALKERIVFDSDRKAWTAAREFDPYRSAQARPAAPTPETPATAHAAATIDATAQAHGIQHLTAEDKQFLAEQFEQYVRPTTAEERRADPTLGPRVVDAKFLRLMQRVASDRAQTAKVAQTAETAAKANMARLNAAATGRRPGTPAPRRPAAPNTTNTPSPRVQDSADAWDLAERASAAAMRQR